MKTIKDVELQIEQRLPEMLQELGLMPRGYSCRARLHGKSRDKKRTAALTSWSPDTDSINIWLQRVGADGQTHFRREAQTATAADTKIHDLSQSVDDSAVARVAASDAVSDLIRALDRAESRPGYDFVALKWFRDTALLLERFPWVNSDSARHNILREAIDKRIILTSRVPNPKAPQFPVTAIRLNRLMPQVKATLGSHGEEITGFAPIPIRGENLSATVLRDRR